MSNLSSKLLVVGGSVVATLLSLYVVPVFYTIAVGLQKRLTSEMASPQPEAKRKDA